MKNERKSKTSRIAAHPEKKNGQEPAAPRKPKPAEEVLERSSLPEQNPNPVMRFRQDGQPLYGNPAASLLLGFSMDQSVPEEWRGLLQTALTSGASHEIEVERHGRVFSALFVPVQEAGYVNVYCMDRTDHKKTEAALRRSEERFRQAADASGALVYEVDLLSDTTVILHGMERLTGYSSQEILSTRDWWHSLIHPDDLSTHLAQLDQLLQTKGIDVDEYRLLHKNGQWIHVQDRRLAIQDNTGKAVCLIGTITDITTIKAAEEERNQLLQREQSQRERAQRASTVAEEAKIRAERELWERQQAEAALGTWADSPLPQDARPAWLRYGIALVVTAMAIAVRQLLDPLLGDTVQYSLLFGSIAFSIWYGGVGPALLALLLGYVGITWFVLDWQQIIAPTITGLVSLIVFLFSSGIVIALGVAMARAQRHAHQSAGVAVKRQQEVEFRLHEQQRTEESLRASEQRFREVFETAGVSVWVEDFSQVRAAIDELRLQGVQDFRAYFADNPDFVQKAIGLVRILDVNQETLDLYGAASKDDLLGSLHKIFVPETETVFVEELVALAEGREVYRSETQARTLDGRRISFLFTIHFGSPAHDYSRVIVTITDITERKRAEDALQFQNERFMRFIDSNIIGIVIGDAAGTLELANDYYLNLLGVTRQEFDEGKVDWKQFTPLDWLHADEKSIRELQEQGVSQPYEKEYVRADGVRVPVYIANAKLPGPGGGIAAFVLDITERRRAERALLEYTRQQESLFKLAERLQHEHAPNDIYNAALDAILDALQCDRASILLFDETDRMRFVSWRGLSDHYRRATDGHSPWKPEDRDIEPIYYNEIGGSDISDALKDTIQSEGIRSLAFIPLVPNGRLIGKFMVYFNTHHEFTETDLDLSLTIARQLAFAIDRQQAQEKLRVSEDRLRLAVAAGNIGIWDIDLRRRDRIWSKEGKAIYGLAPEEFLDYPRQLELTHPEDRELVDQMVTAFRDQSTLKQLNFEHRLQHPDGSVHWVEVHGEAIYEDEPLPVRLIGTILDITERKQAEEELKAARARAEETAFRIGQLQKVTASLSEPLTPSQVADVLLKDGIWALGAAVGSVMIISADGQSLEIIYSTAPEAVVKPFLHIPISKNLPATDAARSGRLVWLESREAYLQQYPNLSESINQWSHMSGLAIPMKYKGRIVGVLTASFDHPLPYNAEDEQFALTIARQGAQAFERARAEEALRTSESLYRNIARSIPGGGVYVVDKDFRYIVAEGPVTEAFGLTRQMLEGRTVTEVFPDERGNRMEDRLRRNFAGETISYETTHNGRTYWTQQATIEPAREQVIIVTMDITERKKAEESLKHSEERFRQFMEHLPGLAWIKDLQGHYAYANAAAQKAFRTPSDILYGKSDAEIFSVEVASQFMSHDQRAITEGGVQVIETLEHEDGPHHSLMTKFPIPGLDDSIAFIGGIAIDVTERMRAEEALRHSEERMRLAIESNRMVAWEWDPATDKIITSANIVDVYGMTGVDGAANAFALIWPEDLPAHQEKVDRVMLYGGEYHSEFRITRPVDGRVMWMEEWASSLTDAHGRVTRLVGIVTDVTERKQAEQSLKQARAQAEATADRMASLQTITAALVGSVTPMQLAELILEQGTHASGASAGILVEVVHQGRDIKTLAALGYPEAAVRRMPVPLSDSTPISDCILKGQSIWIGSHEEFAAQYPSLAEFRGSLGNEATVALPLMIGDRIIGALAFSFTEKRDFLLEERGFLLAVAQQCAQTLERIRAADSLRESQQRLALTYDHAAVGLVETSPDWRLMQCNDEFTRILGYAKEELLGRSVAEITYEEDAHAEGELYRRLMSSEIPFYRIEKRFIRKDGSLTWCELVRSAVLDDSGAARFGIGAVFDINERKRREEVLRAQTEEIETLMEVSPIAIFVSHDPACAHVTGNPAAHALLELPPDASNLSKSAPDEQRPGFRVLREGVELAPDDLPMQVAARLGIEVEADELELQFEDGTHKFEYAFARPLFDAQGRSRGAIAAMLDITERKRTEQQLRASEERYRFIVENTSDGIWRIELTEPMPLTLSEDEQVEWYFHHAVMKQCNLELARMYGYESAEDVIGLPIHVILPFETNVELTRQFIRAQYRLVDAESRIRHRDGRDLYFLNNMIGIIEDGKLLGQWGTNRDITQRKRAEERLALLAEISELTRDLEDPLALMAAVSDIVGRHMQVKRCLFNEIDVQNDLEVIHHDYHDGVDSVRGVHKVTEYSNTTTGEMQDGQTVINFDSKTDPRTAQDYERSYVANGERSYIAIPLMRDDDWVASLWISDDKPRRWSDEEVSLLETVAERTWTAVEKLRIHAALRDSEERLRVTFNTTAVGFATLTPDTRFVDVNQAFCTVVGYTREELLTMNFDYLTHPNYVKSTRDHMDQLLKGEVSSFVIEKLYLRKDGSEIWVQNSVSLVRDIDGKPLHLIVISQDITERKRIEQELYQLNLELEARVEKRTRELQAASELRRMAMAERRQAQDRFAKSFNASPAAMSITRFEDGMYRNVNPRFTELLEYNLEDVIGHTSLELNIYRDPQERMDLLKTIRSNKGRWDYETQLTTRTGNHLDVVISVVEIELDGEPHILSMITDVTERNQMLTALRASEQQLRTLFDVLPVGVSYVSSSGRVIESNRTLEKIIDITRDELHRGIHNARQYIRADGTPMPPSEFASTRALAEERTIKNVETGIIKEGGQVIWTSVSATPISMPEPGVVVITVDVTERKHMDDELRRSHRRYQILSQRLVEIQEEERRTISRELHDRVGQSLAALNLNLNFMNQSVPADTPSSIRTRIKDAIQLTEETVATIRDVMADLRPPALDDYGLEAALNAYADTFSRRFGIRVDLVKPADLLPRLNSNIELTLLRIAQEALTNVAKHSHASKATLTLAVHSNAVYLTIEDNGEGIRSWQKANRPGSHGLKIMRERAETFGGTLQVQSFSHKGTRIEVKIPIQDDYRFPGRTGLN